MQTAVETTGSVVGSDHPTEEMIEAGRRRFPTDSASQIALDLKFRRRGGPIWMRSTPEELSTALTKFLEKRVEGDFAVTDTRWLTGGASKIQMAFTLNWSEPGRGPVADRMLLRMDPPETLNATFKQTEAELISAARGVLPVPAVRWTDAYGDEFPEPALVCDFVDGVTKPQTTKTGQVSGLGTNFGPELRAKLAPQFVQHLAALHSRDVSDVTSDALVRPDSGTNQSALWRLNFERQIWEQDRGEDVPLMDVAAGWLERNLPVTERVSLVHGDFRSGNFLFDETSATVTAWLDWELGHLGDRHADLAYCTQPLYGHYAEDGKTFLASGMLPREDLFEQYEKASGLTVDPARIEWYSVFCSYYAIVKTLATSYRVARLGRSHQDVLLARLEGVVPVLVRELGQLLEKVV
ncbi:phosphotransferase family protein [Rhodococcus opacus]|uniref:phosphotransferase family protein n=1 Tax=Rhodococcus opacus TaxID=37919 RepID=UPI002475C600|nr:phosphotransferase family protein [Rhodococcus opacus]MDH6288414.1 aminoglycoside phosphotransferase (APT) family kinase protein [Rhodococcus opacus]